MEWWSWLLKTITDPFVFSRMIMLLYFINSATFFLRGFQ
jgi:hypothetical protein